MLKVHIDFETRSTVDLRACGAYRYAADPTTSVNCMAWAVGDGPVQVWSRGDAFPDLLMEAIEAGAQIHAWNAQFERLIWQHCQLPLGWPTIQFEKWRCTAARSAYVGHPRKLETAAKMMLPSEQQKDMAGALIMRSMSKPIKKTKKNQHIKGLIWVDDLFSQAICEAYCKLDVVVERAMDAILPEWPQSEVEVWQLNERINDRGVPFDRELCISASYVMDETTKDLSGKISALTDGKITTGNQILRIKNYVNERGINEVCFDKHHVEALLETDLPDDVRDVLLLRQVAAGAAAKKFVSAVDVMDPDERGRGLFMYYGAITGRFASLKTQIQNMKHGADTTSLFRDTICSRDMGRVREAYNGTIITTLGKNVRSLVCAPKGYTLVRCDSSQIEARVLSWLAGDENMLGTFRAKEDPYIKLAEKVFNKTVGKKDDERKIGKAAVLGLGFGMGAKRFKASVWETAKIELTERFAQQVVDVYRADSPLIVKFWSNLEKAAFACIERKIPVRVGRILFRTEGDYMTVTLPSGRKLFYYKPHVEGAGRKKRFGYTSTRGVRHEWAGGLLCENVVQATARDTLVHYMALAMEAGLDIVAHVHDELMVQCKIEAANKTEKILLDCFDSPTTWMQGLPCAAEAKISKRYGD